MCGLEEYFTQAVVEPGKLSLLFFGVQLSNGSCADASQIMSWSPSMILKHTDFIL